MYVSCLSKCRWKYHVYIFVCSTKNIHAMLLCLDIYDLLFSSRITCTIRKSTIRVIIRLKVPVVICFISANIFVLHIMVIVKSFVALQHTCYCVAVVNTWQGGVTRFTQLCAFYKTLRKLRNFAFDKSFEMLINK